jgi:hypothetical protein
MEAIAYPRQIPGFVLSPWMMMDQLSINSAVAAVKDQVSCEVGEETVILNVRSGEYFGLNAVGAMIWEWIQTPRTVQKVQGLLVSEFPEVPEEQLARDLMSVLEKLLEANLIETVEDAAVER